MLLAREFIGYLSRQLVARLTPRIIETSDSAGASQAIADIIEEDLSVEDRLNDEVRDLLSQYADYMRENGVSYQEMFRRIKNTLVTQRKVIRAAGRDTGDRMKLSRDLFEFSVLIVARRWTAQFEWFAHSRYALEAGVSPAIVDAIAAGKVPDGMSADQALLHAFVTQVMESGSPSDDTFARARDRFGLPTTLDLIGMCGYYTMLAFVLNSAQVQVPEGGATLKPL